MDSNLLDPSREKTLLDAEGKTEAAKLAGLFKNYLSKQNIEIEAKSLATDTLPGFVLLDEQERRFRDYMMRLGPSSEEFSSLKINKQTLVINTNNHLISNLLLLDEKDPELVKEITIYIYQLCLLSQKELEPNSLNDFIQRSAQVLEKLSGNLLKSS